MATIADECGRSLELERNPLNRNLLTNAGWTVPYDRATETEMRIFGYLI